MIEGILGFPTNVGNSVLGASSPERPALQFPDPLSITTGTLSAISVTNSVNIIIENVKRSSQSFKNNELQDGQIRTFDENDRK